MKPLSQDRVDAHINELTQGKGYLLIPGIFSKEQTGEAREIILSHSRNPSGVTHFQGANKDKMHLQRRVWNLLNKGQVFVDMVEHPLIRQIVSAFLGDEFCLGSIAANRIMPGGPGQEPHIDYPYWDMYKQNSFPTRINASFPLNCQVTIMLNDFDPINGATAVLPGTQKLCRYPQKEEEKDFYDRAERMCGKEGDIAIFFGLAWHCAMPNNSEGERIAVLIQYLPKFVKPMEDQVRGVKKEVVESASPLLKQLLGMDYPYPKILEEETGGNTEGREK